MIFAKCHPDRKHAGKGLCNSCYCAQKYRTIPEHRRAINAKQQARRSADKARSIYETTKSTAKRLKYCSIDMSLNDFRQWYNNHPKTHCEICNEALQKPIVDHCHKTGRVRGIICFRCNVTLSKLDEIGTRPFTEYLAKFV